tara:strand:- start:53520 stop:54731 length:1212 start_codon:yes stop_codon:yes gene_type:complete
MKDIKNVFGKYNGKELEYISRVLSTESQSSTQDNNYPSISRLEESFCNLTGSKYAISVNSATSGLHASLIGCGIKPGDEVIQPGLTVVMNSFVTLISGGIPVFCDIDKDTWNITADNIRPLITSRTKAIMPVSLFGVPVDLDPIMDLASEYNITVIDDSAETVCGQYKGEWAGTKADCSIYSFENKKHISSGSEGGIVITNDDKYAEKIRKFCGLGYKNLTASAGRTNLASSEFQRPNYIRHDSIGLNYRMNQVTAAVALAQIERVEHLVERRISVGNMFNQAVSGCNWMIPQKKSNESNHTYYTFGVIYNGFEEKGVKWEDFYNRYREMGGDGFYGAWVNPYLEEALKGKIYGNQKLEEGLCPVAENCQKKIMLFKTNYRDLGEARKNAKILENLIRDINLS